MKEIKLLLKKDGIEKTSVLKDKKDIFGIFTSILLLSVIYCVFIYVFKNFSDLYIATDFGDLANQEKRISEVFVMSFSVFFVINIIGEVKKIYDILTRGKEDDILIYQPINTGAIFVYKLLKVYLSQIITTLIMLLPVFIVLDVLSTSVGGFAYYLLMIVITLLLPLISCALATLISIPYTYISKRIQQHFIIKLIIYVLIVGSAFYLYGIFLNILGDLIRTGNIRYIFDFKTIESISNVCNNLYPSKLFVDMLFFEKFGLNLLVILATAFIASLVSYFIIKKMYLNIMQEQLEGSALAYSKKSRCKQTSPLFALLKKEFKVVLRTPSYAFQYFAMAISLPLMVYVCSSLLESMLQTLTFVNCNYALSIFVVSMFGILTNSFCTTNISRDGKMFGIMKTLPVSVKMIVNAKVTFCGIVSCFSVLISTMVLCITEFLDFKYTVITFIIGFVFSLIQIAYATRKDMKRPSFPNNDKEEVVEGNFNMSTLIIVGLISTVLISGGALLMSIVLSLKYDEKVAAIASIGFMFLITISILVWAIIYLYKDIEEEYLSEEF